MMSTAIIRMDGQKTAIINPKIESTQSEDGINGDNLKEFTFDFSYWSFDPYDPGFASQEQVYKDLGSDVVTDAFEGYNCCIFAYGQTGSGKTYTMMGTPDSEGLIPRICQQLFARMKSSRDSSATYRTEVSYLEIYNETVKDLLSKNCLKQNLRVREHPKLGPYVEALSKHLVQDYSDLQELMNRGNAHRTTASTKMNDTSSRSHAIFTISFSMASFSGNTPRETLSKINLVDLAGSERATTTKAEGQRLIEGGHINKSLVTLGSVISALADKSSNPKKKQFFIPYRDSVLTWLLKDSLGGNSKTIMIAALSPADCNYGETLSTLRYANRAKNIINKPTINEDLNTKLIRELRSEIERLQSMINVNDCPNALERVAQNEEKVRLLTEEWTEKWKETHKILREQQTLGLRRSGFGIVLDSELPHLVGIDDDLLSTGITLYHLKEGKTTIGTEFADIKPDIVLHNGEEVEDEHCYIELKEGVVTLVPLQSSTCFVNAIRIEKPLRLTQGCIIVLGQNMFRFNDPKEVQRLRNEKEKNGSTLNLSKILSRSSDFSKSFESIDSSEIDSMGTEINEKRRQIEDMEKEYKLSEEKRRAELLAADKQLEEKRSELQRLKNESEKLSQIISESKLIIQNNDSILNICVKSSDETKSISDMLSSMKVKTQDAKRRVSDVLSTITSNRKESLEDSSLLKNIYETLSEQIDKMGNEFNDCPLNDNKNLNFVKNNIFEKLDNNVSDLMNKQIVAQNINENKCHSKCFNDFDNNNKLSEIHVRNDLNPIPYNNEKVLLLSNESKDSPDIQSVVSKGCDLNRNIEDNAVDIRLNEMKSQFEGQLSDLQKHLDSQRISYESERDNELQRLQNERKLLQELEESQLKLKILVEREVQKKLQQMAFDNSLRSEMIDSYLSSSPMSPLSPNRSLHSIPSLSDILENSSETLVPNKQSLNSNVESLNRILISINKYVLRGLSTNTHHEYEIQIDINGNRWSIYRRYRRFRELHNSLCHKYGQRVQSIYFPPKIYFDYRTESVAKERKKYLEVYLKELIAVCQTIRNCPLNYKAFGLKSLTKECLEEFSPFFIKDCFEVKHILP